MRLIDADALMELAHNHINGTVDCNDIARFPTIEAKPVKHAQWILDTTYPGKKKTIYFCSRCGHWQAHRKNREPSMDAMYMRFCPECGARMDGGKQDG